MSKTIVTVMKDFKNHIELKRFAEAQHNTISLLQEKLSSLELENKQLKDLLVHTNKDVYVNKAIQIDITSEESIIVEQIDFLRQASMVRVLSIEEIKKLDILIKNLNLIKSQPTTIVGEAKPLNITEAKLIEIAAHKEDE